jgi:hypothetical protein
MPRTKTTKARRTFTAEELPYPARMRLEHASRWIAWTQDMDRVIAAGDDPETVRTAALAAGVEGPILEWVPPVPVRPIGGPV